MSSLVRRCRPRLVVLAAGLACLLSACGGGDAKAPQAAASAPAGGGKAALTVSTTRPTAVDWPHTLTANGSVAAWQEAVVGPELGGLRITEVRVNVGDKVRKGQVLARLAGESVAADAAAARAGVAEAEATLVEAQANLERTRQLREAGMASAQQLVQGETAVGTAEARLQAQRARQRAEAVRLAQTTVVAPDDGVISARSATVGSIAQGELFRLIRGGRLEWRAEVTEVEMQRLKPGMSARLVLPGGGEIAGRVRVLAPTVDPQTRIGLVYVDLPEGSPARAGMFARGRFETGSTQALSLPQSAVMLRDGFSYVLVLQPDSRVRLLKVATGRRVGDRVEIASGLTADAQVVVSGGAFLADGDRVRVAPAAR